MSNHTRGDGSEQFGQRPIEHRGQRRVYGGQKPETLRVPRQDKPQSPPPTSDDDADD